MTNKKIFLETANRIGKKLTTEAIWDKNICTWNVNVPDRTNHNLKRSVNEPAGGGIYQGTAGISVFLSELFKHTHDDVVKKTAIGAVKYALKEARRLPLNSFGFHSGRIGIAYAAHKAGEIFCNEEFVKEALDLMLEMRGNENRDYGLDVIGGSGGAIPIILQLADYYNNNHLFEMGISLGENLISNANIELTGWSWGSNKETQARNLCGHAHGASGIGQAFLELYNVTGSKYFLYAADQAFTYERQFFNSREKNWPDFRHATIGLYSYYESREQLKERAKNGEFKPYVPAYMSAWCHGAPGIGLSRLRAYELLKDIRFKLEAEQAIENTINSLSVEQQNYSLCHGALGNAETLIYGYQVLGKKDYLNKAEEIAIRGYESVEKNNKFWKCGTLNGVNDPSFMLGEAGIGYYFLRILNINTPSLLIPTTGEKEIFTNENKDSALLINAHMDNYFHRSFHVLEKFIPVLLDEIRTKTVNFNPNDSSIDHVIEIIDKTISTTKDETLKKFLQDSVSIEKAEISLITTNKDFTKDFIYYLKKDDFHLLDKDRAILFIHELSRQLTLHYNWNEHNVKEDLPEAQNGDYLIINQQNMPVLKRLNVLTSLILNELDHPLSINSIVKKVFENFEIDNEIERKLFEEKIINQLKELYNANIIQSDGVIKNMVDENKETNNGSFENEKCDTCKSKSAHVY